ALRMADVAQIGDGQRGLAVGCGIGDPTLQVAVLVGPHGRVLGIDLVEDMIATARERATALGLSHVEFRAGDVTTIDLPAAAYDAVLARWSVIYLTDVGAGLARLRSALGAAGSPSRRGRLRRQIPGSRFRWRRSPPSPRSRRLTRGPPACFTSRPTVRWRTG